MAYKVGTNTVINDQRAGMFTSLSANTPLPITSGGTGNATKSAAFDALAPAGSNGTIIIVENNTYTALAKGAPDTVLTTNSTSGVEYAQKSSITLMPEDDSGGSTNAFSFSVPSNAKKITLMIENVSPTGTAYCSVNNSTTHTPCCENNWETGLRLQT